MSDPALNLVLQKLCGEFASRGGGWATSWVEEFIFILLIWGLAGVGSKIYKDQITSGYVRFFRLGRQAVTALPSYTNTIADEWLDYNGHLNVAYYL
ncbi:MAG: hypothetical protein AAF556_04740, partial [Pseudomonadota bacterium]